MHKAKALVPVVTKSFIRSGKTRYIGYIYARMSLVNMYIAIKGMNF